MPVKKEVQKSTRKNSLNLTILNLLKQGFNPSKICHALNISKTKCQYYLSLLKENNKIKKTGYGTWEVLSKQVQIITPRIARNPKPDSVRGHAFQFTLKLPKEINGWNNRKEILRKNAIPFTDINSIFGGAERIIYHGRKVILTNKSIIVYEPKSYYAETSVEAKSFALADFLTFIDNLGSYLGISLRLSRCKIKISRQHYALIYNSLAKQYDREGNKLTVEYAGEQWFIIDNSFNLHEAETIHPRTAEKDNRVVQDFFNGLKTNPITPKQIIEMVNGVVQNQVLFDNNINKFGDNLNSHLAILQKLGQAVDNLTAQVKLLSLKKD